MAGDGRCRPGTEDSTRVPAVLIVPGVLEAAWAGIVGCVPGLDAVHPDPDTADLHLELLPSFDATAQAVETLPAWWHDPVGGRPLRDGQRRDGSMTA